MNTYRVIIDENNAVIIDAADEFAASFGARIKVWEMTGRWLKVKRVEVVK